MRDLVLLLTIFASVPFCFARPFIGVLLWTWLGLMNPHRLTWGADRFPVAFLVGGATLLGLLVSAERKRLPHSFGTYGILALWLGMSLSTLFAFRFDLSVVSWTNRSKMLLMIFVVLALVNTRQRLRWFCFTIAGSIGFYGVKGGIFAVVSGAHYHVLGPEKTFIGDNNSIALAINMALPFLFYLARDVPDRRLRLALRVAFGLSIMAVVCTYSRGGFLGLALVMLLLVAKSQRKLLAGTLVAAAIFVVPMLMPDKWANRMETIQTYEQDSSAMSRIYAWRLAWRLGLARPLTGWGPNAMEDRELYRRYYPDSPRGNDVHSAYFQILSESGFATFAVFLALMVWVVLRLQRLSRAFRAVPEDGWVKAYADMLQISTMAFAVSGAFLEVAYFDLIYYVVAAATALETVAPPLPVLAPWTRPYPLRAQLPPVGRVPAARGA